MMTPIPDPCTNPPCDTAYKPKELVWQVATAADSSSCISNRPLLYKGDVVFTKYLCTAGIPLFFMNKSNGKLNAYNTDVLDGSTSSDVANYLYQNYYAIQEQAKTFVFDLDQRKLIHTWNVNDLGGEGYPRINGIGPWVYLSWYTNKHVGKKYYTNSMVRRNMITSEYDTICTIKSDLCYTPFLEAPVFWINPQNDTVMIFQNRQYRFGNPCNLPSGYRIDLYAYNITQDKMEWSVQDFAITKQSSVQLPQIFDNKVFFQGSNEAFVFDCFTGQLVWSQYFPGESFFNANAVLAEGKIILKSETDRMIALDALSGNIVWDNPNAGASQSNMIYYKKKVYYETGEGGLGIIRAIRVSDGVITWTEFPKNYTTYSGNTKFSGVSYGLSGIAIDEETGLLYCHDRIFMQCIKIPD